MFKKLIFLFILITNFNDCLFANDKTDNFDYRHSLMPIKKDDTSYSVTQKENTETKRPSIKDVNTDKVKHVYQQKTDEYNLLKTKYNNIKKELKQLKTEKEKTSTLNTSEVKQNILYKQNEEPNTLKQTPIVKTPLSRLHLASYKDETSTYKGIKIFKNLYDTKNHFDISVQYEYVEKKGWFYRVYFLGEKQELINLCDYIKSKGNWCSLK